MVLDLEEDVTFPARADDWVETLGIGTLLTLFGVLVVPIFPVYGYLVHTARAAMGGVEEPISFTDWGTLLVDGVKSTVVVLVYQLPPTIVAIVSVAALVGVGLGNDALAGASLLVFVLGSFVALILSLLLGYFSLVAVLAFASEDDLGAAFDLARLRSVGLDGDYAVQWLYGVALVFAANVVLGLAMFLLNVVLVIPIIGLVIAFFGLLVLGPVSAAVSFYAQIVVFRVWGRAYAESRGLAADDVPDWVGRDEAGDADRRRTENNRGNSAALASDSRSSDSSDR